MTSERITTTLLLAVLVPGCILVGHTGHRIERLADGDVAVTLRYTDLRTDAQTDSAAAVDLDILLDSFSAAGATDTVQVLNKYLGLRGDTLVAEIRLRAPDLAAVNRFYTHRLFLQDGRPTVLVPQNQLITWTNGTIRPGIDGGLQIQWSDSARILEFDLEPGHSLPARSLAPLFRERAARGEERP